MGDFGWAITGRQAVDLPRFPNRVFAPAAIFAGWLLLAGMAVGMALGLVPFLNRPGQSEPAMAGSPFSAAHIQPDHSALAFPAIIFLSLMATGMLTVFADRRSNILAAFGYFSGFGRVFLEAANRKSAGRKHFGARFFLHPGALIGAKSSIGRLFFRWIEAGVAGYGPLPRSTGGRPALP